jgi:tetratricopeptide (TPR) repeat protein
MLLSFIAFPIAGIGLIVSATLIGRHWKELRLLDPLSIKEERERRQRDALIQRRFERLHADKIEPFRKIGERLKQAARKSYHRTYERLQAFEALYKNIKHPFSAVTPTTRDRIQTLLRDARSLIRDLKWADAERRYLEVLSIDTHQAEAYRGLGEIYLKQKLYPQAKETFEFLVKMKEADDGTYAGLAEIAEEQGDLEEAEDMRLKAVEHNPRQAHRHAQLAEFYIEQDEPTKAWPSAKRASDLEPMSAKYLECSLEVAILLGDRKEARQRYDRLRLLAEDRTKFQSWREKVEALEAKGGVLAK